MSFYKPISEIHENFKKVENSKQLFGAENKGIVRKGSTTLNTIILRKVKGEISQRIKNKLSKHIKPIHAEIIKDYIPSKGDFTFFLMNGNCQFADFISEFIKNVRNVDECYFTTLSLNVHSFNVLDQILCKKYILLSSYFLATDKAKTLPKLKREGRLLNYEIGFYRNHTKMCLLKCGDDHFVFTGSANLRSSSTIEQFTIFNDALLYAFNKDWIAELINKFNFNNEFESYENTGSALFETIFNKVNHVE